MSIKVFFILVLVLLFIIWYAFPRVLVCGDSMYPTYKNDEILHSKRFFNRKNLQVGDVVVVHFKKSFPIEGERTVIKRIAFMTEDSVFLLGDNPSESYDSRYYGEVPKSYVKCLISEQRAHEVKLEAI